VSPAVQACIHGIMIEANIVFFNRSTGRCTFENYAFIFSLGVFVLFFFSFCLPISLNYLTGAFLNYRSIWWSLMEHGIIGTWRNARKKRMRLIGTI